MDIEATNPMAPVTRATDRFSPPSPETSQINDFNKLLFGQPAGIPETELVSRWQAQTQKVDSAFQAAATVSRGDPVGGVIDVMSPEKVVNAQSTVSKAVVLVDLTAKIAGSVSQGVNKLTSMQ